MSTQHHIETGADPPGRDASRRPTEDECWLDFWSKIATIWASLPHEAQRGYIDEAPGNERQDRRAAS